MARQPQPAPFDGALVIHKPKGKTSHDIVDAVRRLAGFRQIGHLGTLDPLATGVLVLLLGKATRLVRFYAGRRKHYNAAFRFGYATNTYDSEGTATGPETSPALDRELIERLAGGIRGTIRADAADFFRKENSWPTRVRTGAQESGCRVKASERGSIRIPADGDRWRGGAFFD